MLKMEERKKEVSQRTREGGYQMAGSGREEVVSRPASKRNSISAATEIFGEGKRVGVGAEK